MKNNSKMIPVSATTLSGNEYQYLIQCLNNRWFSQGYFVREFEARFADYIGVKHALACSSGTAALHLAYRVLATSPSETVAIVPALTYVATANAANYCGFRVAFADVDRDSWTMNYQSAWRVAEEAQEERTICVPVHMFDALASGIPSWATIRDSCHAPIKGDGLLGDCACYSFYASKHISCGEGGMLVTNSDQFADRVRLWRGQGATTPGTYHHSVVGYNYRMTDLQAAVGLAQLETLDERIRYRRQIIDRYRERLGGNSKITLQGGERASGWMFACLLPFGTYYEGVRGRLLELGIETRPFFEPLNSLPMYGSDSFSTPIASEVSRRGICLPTHCEMDDTDVDYICDSLEEVLG